MRPGILLQHAQSPPVDDTIVRSDVTGIIGAITRPKWPRGALRGDFVELVLSAWSDVSDATFRDMFDSATIRAVRAFFLNGGNTCHLLGVCVASEEDLLDPSPVDGAFRSLFDHLRGEENIGLLCMPLLAYYSTASAAMLQLLLAHCQEMTNRFAVIDAPRDLHDEPLFRWVSALRDGAGDAASYGAIYYPWLMDGEHTMPPSGSIAGLFARMEKEHSPYGIRWPPANQPLQGVTHLSIPLRWREADALTAAHINPILTQPLRGVIVWGARTLSREPRWQHINSRRIVSVISEQLRRDSDWVVFEHQRPELWSNITRSVLSRLNMLWNAGLLTGDKSGLQYDVQCDAELNPPGVRDAGQVHVRVQLRPISTTEHIVLDLRLGA